MKSLFFVGGCSGTGSPVSARITCPSVRNCLPLAVANNRSEFGHHTTSFGVLRGDEGLFIDNGDGISHVAQLLLKEKVSTIYGFQTHEHEDHRLGLQNNKLLYAKGLIKEIYAPKLPGKSFRELWEQDFSTETWPVSPRTFGIEHRIVEFEPGEILSVFGGVETFMLEHPNGAAAFKIHLPGGTLVVATDNEIVEPAYRKSFAAFISGAALLYADVQYRDDEYRGLVGIGGEGAMARKGWGHSTPSMIAETFALCDRVPAVLVAGHHDPSRSDEDLICFERETKKLLSTFKTSIRFARECDVFEI